MALAIVAMSWLLAQFFAVRSETLLAPVVHNVLLRSVVGSIISGLLVIGGLMLALGTLRLTHAVMSVVGVSGLIVLAVGFAFRDITENFIASVLLGVRRPFQIGDYVTIAGQSGVVKSLNTRATVLVTLDGKHVRIPNSTIFKEIMVNATASPSFRSSFDVVVPNEASTADAIDALNRAQRETRGILTDPPPRTLVESLEPGGVRLRADFWTSSQNVDWFQIMSDVKLKAKVALQQAGVIALPVAAPPPSRRARPMTTGVAPTVRRPRRLPQPHTRPPPSSPAMPGRPATPRPPSSRTARPPLIGSSRNPRLASATREPTSSRTRGPSEPPELSPSSRETSMWLAGTDAPSTRSGGALLEELLGVGDGDVHRLDAGQCGPVSRRMRGSAS